MKKYNEHANAIKLKKGAGGLSFIE